MLRLRLASEGYSKREFVKMGTDKEKSEQKCVRVRFYRLINSESFHLQIACRK
jgi:hypothetical protein